MPDDIVKRLRDGAFEIERLRAEVERLTWDRDAALKLRIVYSPDAQALSDLAETEKTNGD